MATHKPVVLINGKLSQLSSTDQLDADIDVPLEKEIDETNGGDIIYIGKAQPGSLKSAAVWQIQKITFVKTGQNTDTEIRFADNDASFNQIWDDHLILSYPSN